VKLRELLKKLRPRSTPASNDDRRRLIATEEAAPSRWAAPSQQDERPH
jgi:hypothetical protein